MGDIFSLDAYVFVRDEESTNKEYVYNVFPSFTVYVHVHVTEYTLILRMLSLPILALL